MLVVWMNRIINIIKAYMQLLTKTYTLTLNKEWFNNQFTTWIGDFHLLIKPITIIQQIITTNKLKFFIFIWIIYQIDITSDINKLNHFKNNR